MTMVEPGDVLVQALVRQGVREVFALSGGHLDPIFQACAARGVRIIDTRHEAAAVHMADGYARTTGRPGVALVTAGPGVTNAITGVANAFMDAVPLICIGGRSPLRDDDRMPLQGMDQVALMAPITKFARTVLQPERIGEYLVMAWRHATSGRPGPVFLDIPIDVLFTPVHEENIPALNAHEPERRFVPPPSAIDAALDLLVAAERPVIFAGGGAMFSGAQEELRQFATLAQIPVMANSKARGIVPESTALGYGNFALASSPLAQRAAGGPADVVLLVGARVGMFTGTGAHSLIPPGAKVIQIDIEPEEIGRARDVDVPLVGDVRDTVRLLRDRALGRQFRDHSPWLQGLASSKEAMRHMHDEPAGREHPIHQSRLAREVADAIAGDGIIVADGGETSIWMTEQAVVLNAGDWLSHGYLGCLGVGIPFAIAAKVAHPDKRVVAVVGDGSAGLNIAEFDTAVRHNIPIVVVVNNDQGWGMIRHGQRARYGAARVVAAELGLTRYDQVAAGFGAHSEFVTEASEIGPALRRAFASGATACVNVVTDPNQPHATSIAMATARLEEHEVELPYYGRKKLVPSA
ncbi:MAG: thiamine pyrophosphate-binding protein [Chloroflexi bacterium]|nr:thiamine pyrophosphate-binding protein [Chloroflexota bacterium]